MPRVDPRNSDVLFGRGHGSASHPGNQVLRCLVRARRPAFLRSAKLDKRAVARGIVDDVRSRLGGRFLAREKGEEGGGWSPVDDARAVAKVMHRLRERDPGEGGEEVEGLAERMEEALGMVDELRQQQPQPQQGPDSSHRPESDVGAALQEMLASVGPPDSTLAVFLRNVLLALDDLLVADDVDSSPVPCPMPSTVGGDPQPPTRAPSSVASGGMIPTAPNHNQHPVGVSPEQASLTSHHDPSSAHAFPTGSSNSGPAPIHNATGKLNEGLIVENYRLESSEAGSGNVFFLEGNNFTAASFPTSVASFLASGSLSNHMVVLQDVDKSKTSPQAAVPVPETSDSRRSRTVMENAARLSLLLTESFAGCLRDLHLESTQLEDFSICLERDVRDDHAMAPGSNGFLLRMDISPSKVIRSLHQEPDESETTAAMVLLGKLLYSIFSLGDLTPPCDLLTQSKPPTQGEAASGFHEDIDVLGGLTKMPRAQESTVFSRLIELGSLPVSACRLISDLVDIGPNGGASHPIPSFDDVIRDLEQMIQSPERFLHDFSIPRGLPMQPVFGQTHYGQEGAVSTLRGVVDRMEQSLRRSNGPEPPSHSGCLDVIFVSGIAGSGKSHLVQTVVQTLGQEWLVVKAKFERGKEHTSRSVVSFVFDQLIVNLVKMKESGIPSDVAYSERVSKSILIAIGHAGLIFLATFLPSLSSLFDGLGGCSPSQDQRAENEFRLIYSISKIIEALMEPDRLIVICCDDLQWADGTSLALISEVLVNVGSAKHVCSQCMFIGLFRNDEIDDDHPFTIQQTYLQMMTSNINTARIELSSLSKKDIGDMLMAELWLPCRIVAPLADTVHKKTSGHALFVVELLNSLLRSSVIVYSSQKKRYSWDQDTIDIIQPGDGVAGLIASNLKSLPPTSLRVLRILSCFGIQTDISLLKHLESFQEGILCSLDTYVEMGVLDRAGPIVIFTHDLIQQGVYEIVSLAERQKLHLEIGLFLGGRANIDKSTTIDPLSTTLDWLQLDDQEFYAGKTMTSSLISLACDQIDAVGFEMIKEDDQRVTFAGWNAHAGQQAYRQGNSRAALFYFSKGISFLGEDCWHTKHFKLCLGLHKGAVMALYALGECENVVQYAEKITSNVKFEDSLEIQPAVLISMVHLAKHEECISKGIGMLRQLKLDIPLAPSPQHLMKAVSTTDGIASKLSMDEIMNLCEKPLDAPTRGIFQIADAISGACVASASQFMPVVACATTQFSLHHGICHESTTAWAVFAMLKILFSEDYSAGKYWADAVRAVVKKHGITNFLPQMFLCLSIDIWFMSPRVIAEALVSNHQNAMKKGFIGAGLVSLQAAWRFRLLGGEQLSLVYKSSEDRIRLLAKHSQFGAKHALLDSILLMELTGKTADYFSCFGSSICNMDDLQDVAKSSNDLQLLYSARVINVLIEYWRGNYIAAEEYSRLALMIPLSRMPQPDLIYHTFFRGLILFQLYRMHGNEQRLKDGKEALDRMEKWALVSMAVFENKWLLLKAEYCSSVNDFDQALQMYEGSIRSAQDHGNIHELALAHELLGKFYSECGSAMSNESFTEAYVYYTQWGATAVADKVLLNYSLEMDSTEMNVQTQKRPRQPN